MAVKSVFISQSLSVEAAETMVFCEGFVLALENGKRQVSIANDCVVAMATLNSGKPSYSEFGVLVDEVKKLVEFSNFKCNFLLVS